MEGCGKGEIGDDSGCWCSFKVGREDDCARVCEVASTSVQGFCFCFFCRSYTQSLSHMQSDGEGSAQPSPSLSSYPLFSREVNALRAPPCCNTGLHTTPLQEMRCARSSCQPIMTNSPLQVGWNGCDAGLWATMFRNCIQLTGIRG